MPHVRRLLLVLTALLLAAPFLLANAQVPTATDLAAEQPPAARGEAETTPPPSFSSLDAEVAPPALTAIRSAAHRQLALPAGAQVAIIPVQGMIYDFVLESLQRRIDRAVQGGADVIVLELDTYGGVVTSAIEISKYLKGPQVPVPTIAWINTKAYSAGIMIAAACDMIVMADASSTGDCAPIVPGQDMEATERAKAFSPIASEFDDSARRGGYDYATFHAMCVLGVRLHLIEHKETGERRVVNQIDHALMTGNPADMAEIEKRTTTLGADQDEIAPAERQVASDADLGAWRSVTTLPSGAPSPDGLIHSGRALFTPGNVLAQDIGLSKTTVSNQVELQQFLQAASVTVIPQTWSENLAGFLTSPVVRGVLVLALLLGAYIEFQTPGFGMGGIVAITALVCLLGAPFIIGLAEIWHILLFAAGLALLVIELLTMTTFGLLAVLGLGMMLTGLVLAIVPTAGSGPIPMPAPEFIDRLVASLGITLLALIASLIGIAFLTRFFGNLPGFSRLVLRDEQPALATGAAVIGPVAGDEVIGHGRIAAGMTGRVSGTGLRPAGRAEIGGEAVDVVSEGAFLDPGTRIQVKEVRGNRIVVEAV